MAKGKAKADNGASPPGPLAIRRVRLDDLHADPANVNTHGEANLRQIRDSLREFGQVEPLVVHKATGKVIGGNGRLEIMRAEGWTDVDIVEFDGSPTRAMALALVLNRSAKTSTFDDEALAATLRALQEEGFPVAAAGFDDAELDALLGGLATPPEAEPEGYREPRAANALESRRPLVDVIYTFSASDATCCVAHKSGLLYGVRSTDRACALHPIAFVDNDFKAYDHARHLDAVARYRPKYATVRDIMTRKQCKAAGIEHFDADTIFRWAEELGRHAEHVIVIPKFDCLADVPAEHVLGYSIPTSYGGTPMPVEAFAGRKVHLLGGSPKRQYQHWSALPDDVVSIDTNFINRVSTHGALRGLDTLRASTGLAVLPGLGDSAELTDLGLVGLPNPFYVAFAINCGYYLALFSHRPERRLALDEADADEGPPPADAEVASGLLLDAAGR